MQDQIEKGVSILERSESWSNRPFIVLLVGVCLLIGVGLAAASASWFYITSEREALHRMEREKKQTEYNNQMILLVTNIQEGLELDRKSNDEFKTHIMRVTQEHTEKITMMWSVLMVLEWLPMEVKKNGTVLFQPPAIRRELFEGEK